MFAHRTPRRRSARRLVTRAIPALLLAAAGHVQAMAADASRPAWSDLQRITAGEPAMARTWALPMPDSADIGFELHPLPVLGPESRVLVGGRPRPMPAVRFLAGRAALRPGASVLLAVRPDGRVLGHATVPGREPVMLSGRREAGELTWSAVPAPPVRDPGFVPSCGLDAAGGMFAPPLAPPAAPRAAALGGPPADPPAGPGPAVHEHLLRVAIECDAEFVALFGGDVDEAAMYAATLTAGVSAIFRRDLGFSLRLDLLRLWPDGDMPFEATNLGGFREWWQANEDFTAYELVHLFSGRRDTPYGGVAYLQTACTNNAYGISAFLNGFSPASPPQPSLDTWDLMVVAHEMGHNLSSPHTWNYDPPIDGCFSGVNERGTIMSYCHTRPGGMLNTDVRMHATVQDRIRENNLPADTCLPLDCNGNLVPDDEEIAAGLEADVNGDGIPDRCQDCDGNGVLDPEDIAAGAADLDGNGRPDACDPDCDGDGIPDAATIAADPARDADGDRILDACEADCDGNGVADHLDIRLGTHEDIDRNGVPDLCQDCDGNGVVDWVDAGRGGFEYVADPAFGVREYHGASGVATQTTGDPLGLVTGVHVGGLGFLPDGRLVAAVIETGRLAVLDAAGLAWSLLAEPGAPVRDLTIAGDGTILAVVDGQGLVRFDPDGGGTLGTLVPAGPTLPDLRAVDIDPRGRLLLVDAASGAWFGSPETGRLTGPLPLPAGLEPRAIAGLPGGDLLVCGIVDPKRFPGTPAAWRLPIDGSPASAWGRNYPIEEPWDITYDPDGGSVHVPTRRGSGWRIVQVTAEDEFYVRAFVRADEEMTRPTAVAFRPASPLDFDRDFVPDACQCRPDLDGNGLVGIGDLLQVLSDWDAVVDPGAGSDIDGDGLVGFTDLAAVLSAWGPC